MKFFLCVVVGSGWGWLLNSSAIKVEATCFEVDDDGILGSGITMVGSYAVRRLANVSGE